MHSLNKRRRPHMTLSAQADYLTLWKSGAECKELRTSRSVLDLSPRPLVSGGC